MSAETLVQLLYLVSTALFIMSLKWMSDPESARKGVFAGVAALGMMQGMSLRLLRVFRPMQVARR